MPKIIVTREFGGADHWRAYRIILDGLEIGKLMKGESLTYEVPSGNHFILAKLDWCTTPQIAFDCREGEMRFRVRSNLTGLKILFGLAYLFLPSKWMIMERVD